MRGEREAGTSGRSRCDCHWRGGRGRQLQVPSVAPEVRRQGERQGRRSSGGFTLLEVLLAVTLLAFITLILWGSFSQAVVTKRAIEAAQDRTHSARVALMRIAREVEMAYLSNFENPTLQEKRTRLVSVPHGDVDELSFSSFSHMRLRAGAAEGDTGAISYYGERDPDDRRILNLMRRETRRLQALDPRNVSGEAYVLCPDVTRLKFLFYDYKKKEWRDDWNTNGADGQPYLPTQVKVSLSFVDERGVEVTYSTLARIHMTEKVDYRGARS